MKISRSTIQNKGITFEKTVQLKSYFCLGIQNYFSYVLCPFPLYSLSLWSLPPLFLWDILGFLQRSPELVLLGESDPDDLRRSRGGGGSVQSSPFLTGLG